MEKKKKEICSATVDTAASAVTEVPGARNAMAALFSVLIVSRRGCCTHCVAL